MSPHAIVLLATLGLLAPTATPPDPRFQADAPLLVNTSVGRDLVGGDAFKAAGTSPWAFATGVRTLWHAGDWFAMANLEVQPLAAFAALAGEAVPVAHLGLHGGHAFPFGWWRVMPHAGLGLDLAGRDVVAGPTGGLGLVLTLPPGHQLYALPELAYPVVATGALDRLGSPIVGRPYARLTTGVAWPLADGRRLHLEVGARMEPGAWDPLPVALPEGAMPPKLGPKTMGLVPFLGVGIATK